jgi:hypothetical protein
VWLSGLDFGIPYPILHGQKGALECDPGKPSLLMRTKAKSTLSPVVLMTFYLINLLWLVCLQKYQGLLAIFFFFFFASLEGDNGSS